MKHQAYLNLQRYWSGEITLDELIALNNKITPIVKVEPVVKSAVRVFGGSAVVRDVLGENAPEKGIVAQNKGIFERGCPSDHDSEEWNT